MGFGIKRFEFDRWTAVELADLTAGDLIIYNGGMLKVVAPAFEGEGGQVHLPAEQLPIPVLRLRLENDALGEAMEMCSTDLHDFDDGTSMLTSFSEPSGFVFSPRLPTANLEAFCAEHLEKYQGHFHQYRDQIARCEAVEMRPWW